MKPPDKTKALFKGKLFEYRLNEPIKVIRKYMKGSKTIYYDNCSECNELLSDWTNPITFKYCPNCGAKLDWN